MSPTGPTASCRTRGPASRSAAASPEWKHAPAAPEARSVREAERAPRLAHRRVPEHEATECPWSSRDHASALTTGFALRQEHDPDAWAGLTTKPDASGRCGALRADAGVAAGLENGPERSSWKARHRLRKARVGGSNPFVGSDFGYETAHPVAAVGSRLTR